MAMSGLIYTLDLATRTGYCKGRPGERPVSGSVLLKRSEEGRRVAFGNLFAFLNAEWSKDKPWLVLTEGAMTLEAFKAVNSSEANVRLQYGLHAIAEGMSIRFGGRFIEANNSTVRKHFLGVPNMGKRDATKAAVVSRAQLLGHMPSDVYDEDRADAISIWDWACAVHGRTPPRELHLFGERSKGTVDAD